MQFCRNVFCGGGATQDAAKSITRENCIAEGEIDGPWHCEIGHWRSRRRTRFLRAWLSFAALLGFIDAPNERPKRLSPAAPTTHICLGTNCRWRLIQFREMGLPTIVSPKRQNVFEALFICVPSPQWNRRYAHRGK